MKRDSEKDRLDTLDKAIVLLTKLNAPEPKRWWDRIPFDKMRDLVYILGRFSITRGEMGTFSDDIRQRWDRLQSCAEPV